MSDKRNLLKNKSVVWLAAGLILTVAWSINEAGWTRGLGVIVFVALGAIVIGLMIIRSLLPTLLAHLFSLIIGLGWSFWVTSRLLPRSYSWEARWENLVLRLTKWYNLAQQGGTSYDNLMFILQMAVIMWVVGYLTLWLLFRANRVWLSIVPGGAVLLVNLYYAPRDLTLWLIIYIMLALMLIIRFNLLEHERHWRATHVYFRPDIAFDFLRDGFIFSILLVGLAWFTPTVLDAPTLDLFDRFEGPWREFQEDWNRLFANLNYRPTYQTDSFGQSLTLGGPRHLSDTPVMDVEAEVGRYWRAVVFDEYTGKAWRSTDQDTIEIGPRRLSGDLPAFSQRRAITQTFTSFRDGATVLYALGNPVWSSLDARAHTTFVSPQQAQANAQNLWDDIEQPWVQDLTYLRSRSGIDLGESYQVRSEVSVATVEQLQSAGTDYPNWVRDRYLQLPEGIPQRVFDLAGDITGGFDNPFDKADAIQDYIRTNIKYNEGIEAPPPGRDKVDYILFDLQEAYCDYYATSMIVLLRSQGVPARLAAGYAGGVYDRNFNVYHVLNRHAHSWVEVYFPDYGWIEFEPTPAQPAPARLRGEDGSNLASGAFPRRNDEDIPTELGPEEDEPFRDLPPPAFGLPFFFLNLPFIGQIQVTRAAVGWSGGVLALALAAGGLWWWDQNRRAIWQKSTGDIYDGMMWFARRIGLNLRAWQTPYEQAAELTTYVPEGKDKIDLIAREYVHDQFSSTQVDASRRRAAVRSWQQLRPMLWRSIVRHRAPRFLKNLRR
ncbi:MAG: transglutaminaseTgpA domain-containing protein [Anaerolineae bacterium]